MAKYRTKKKHQRKLWNQYIKRGPAVAHVVDESQLETQNELEKKCIFFSSLKRRMRRFRGGPKLWSLSISEILNVSLLYGHQIQIFNAIFLKT